MATLKKITKKQAIDLSIKKWEFIVAKNGECPNQISLCYSIPELQNIFNNCGLCHYHKQKGGGISDIQGYCIGCPLSNIGEDCGKQSSKFNIWINNQSKETAQGVLNAIKSIKRKNR